MAYCLAQINPLGDCASMALSQCEWCSRYEHGEFIPNYPVPAIQTIVLHKLDGIELHRNLPDEMADGVYYYWPH